MKIKKILISQPKPSSEKSPYFDIAEKFGVEFDFRPFIKVESLSAKEFRQQRISIQDFTAVIFTSRTAIDHFFALCESLRVVMPETTRYFCISEAVALYLQKYIVYRKRKVSFATGGKLEELIPSLVKHSAEKFLLPVSDVHKDELTSILDVKGVAYTKAVMYRTISTTIMAEEVYSYDMLIFFTPVGAESLLKNVPDFEQKDIKIGCLGLATAQKIKDLGLRLDLEAPTAEAPSITAAITLYLKNNQKECKR